MFSSLSVQSSCLLAVSQGLWDFRAGVSMNISQEFEGLVVWSQCVLAASYQGCFTLQTLHVCVCERRCVSKRVALGNLAAATGLRMNWIALLRNLGTGLWNPYWALWCVCVSRRGLVRGNLLSCCLSNNPSLPQCTIISTKIYHSWLLLLQEKCGNLVLATVIKKSKKNNNRELFTWNSVTC